MRKFFSFRSSYGSENDNFAPSELNKSKKKVPSGASKEIKTKASNQKKSHGGFRTPEEYVLKPLNQNLKDEISSNPYLRRSLSFSSAAICNHLNDDSLGSFSDQSKMTSCQDNDQLVDHFPVQCQGSFTPDRYNRLERDNAWLNANEKPSSSSSFGIHQHLSSSSSACSSPVPLKCRTIRSSLISSQSNVLDLYIDNEHEVMKAKNDSKKYASEIGDVKAAENSKISIRGRPPRALSTASSSPHYITDNIRSHSFREIRDKRCDHSSTKFTSDNLKLASQPKYLENNIERTSGAFLGKSIFGIQECNSRINTLVDDTFEGTSDGATNLNSDCTAQSCSFDFITLDKKLDCHWLYKPFDLQRKVPFSRKGHDELFDSKVQEHGTNEMLLQKLKQLEEIYCLSCEEYSDSENLHHGSLSSVELPQNTSKIKEDRRHLATELSFQIRSRLAERSLAKEQLKQLKLELNTRTRRLENENNELKLSLENELDRRANEWSLKLSKFQSEEQRLRERVRELAEQNVSLQREISLFQGNELETKNSIVNIEKQLIESRTSQDELKAENYKLHQTLLNLQECCNMTEEQRDHLRSSSKQRERENMELQKLVVKLQRTCSDQDKTISGLRQSYSSGIEKKFLEGDNDVVQLQTEKMRLTGIEQMLRRELDSYRMELESLRTENIQLLNRFQGAGNGYDFSLTRLNMELHAWVESLKMQSLPLLDDSSHFCGQLIDFIACKRSENFEGVVSETDEYSSIELNLKYQNLTRAIGIFRKDLKILSKTLEEKSSIQESKFIFQAAEIDSSKHQESHRSQVDIEVELKAEAMLTKLFREKIYSRELENELLHRDLVSSIRRCDLLRTDIQRLQDEISCLNHKKKDMEIQMLNKDENLLLLQQDLHECTKDLSTARSKLKKVSEERDQMREEVQHLRENNMQMNNKIKSLQKNIEMLDEEILFKEGQISILKDSLAKKAIDIIGSPNSLKEFNVQGAA